MRTIALRFMLSIGMLSPGLQESDGVDPKVQNLVEEIAAARDPETVARGYTTLFKNPDRKLLAQLKGVKETGVALRAAWEDALLTGANKQEFTRERRLEDGEPSRPKPEAAQRFLGFAEGRLGVQLPPWWEETVRSHHRDARLLNLEEPKNKVSQRGSLEKQGRQALLCVGNERVLLAPAIARKYGWAQRVAISANQKTCLIAFHSTVGSSYPLVCVDRETGDLVWEAKVWDQALEGDVKGVWFENVSLVEQGERVFAFGAGPYWFYVEAFNRKTGRNEFRFANFYAAEG